MVVVAAAVEVVFVDVEAAVVDDPPDAARTPAKVEVFTDVVVVCVAVGVVVTTVLVVPVLAVVLEDELVETLVVPELADDVAEAVEGPVIV